MRSTCCTPYRALAQKYRPTTNAVKNHIDNTIETGTILSYNPGPLSAIRGVYAF